MDDLTSGGQMTMPGTAPRLMKNGLTGIEALAGWVARASDRLKPRIRRAGSDFPGQHRRRTWRGAVLTLLLALPALWPLLRPGFLGSDDGLFHVYRIAALADAWAQGVLHPRLFPAFGFGYGQAVLNFYAPLAYWPGALLAALGIAPPSAAQLTMALGFLLAALAAYGYGRYLWGPAGGVAAAVAFTYFPYHLADAYQRGAVPEFMAFIWLPLILWAYTAAFRADDPVAGGATVDGDVMLSGRVPCVALRQEASEASPSYVRDSSLVTRRGPRFAVNPLRVTPAAILGAEAGWGPLLWGALAWAGLIYTHNLTALLMLPAWLLYILVLAVWTRRWRRLGGVAGSWALALALSAPLWLPFLAERRYVGLAAGPSDGYRAHLAALAQIVLVAPFHRYAAALPAGAEHPLSWLTAALCLLTLGLLLWRLARRQRPSAWPLTGCGLLLALTSASMTTQPSLPIWRLLEPLLAQLQYPWRFLILAAVGVMLAAGALPSLILGQALRAPRTGMGAEVWRGAGVDKNVGPVAHRPYKLISRTTVLLAPLTLALLLQPLPNLPAQSLALPAAAAWASDRMWREDAEAGQVGATWTGEFLPLAVQEQRWALGRPRAGAQDGVAPASHPTVRVARLGYNRWDVALEAAAPLTVRLHQFYLPAWQALVNGRRVATYPSGELALVSTDVPAGASRVVFRFGPAPAWRAGGGLALLAVALWVFLAWRGCRTDRRLRWAALALAVAAVALALNGLGIGQRAWTPEPVQVAVGDVALLIGYDAHSARDANAVDVTLYWFALRDVGSDLKTFVHLLGPDGQVMAQHDGDPAGGFTPTTRWRSGEIIPDRHRVPLPPGLSAGDYRLVAGMYQPESLRNLPLDPPTPDGRADLGSMRLPFAAR